ncbi:unnamed protein product [Prunus armeniaca]
MEKILQNTFYSQCQTRGRCWRDNRKKGKKSGIDVLKKIGTPMKKRNKCLQERCVCLINQGNTVVVVPRMWTDVGSLGMLAYEASAERVDEIARMRKFTILECLVRFCDAVENLYTREYLRKPTPRDLQRFLQKGETRGFPKVIGSIDCMHWQWKNCPIAWQGEYGNRKG